MRIRDLHSWSLSYSQARELQVNLAGKVQFTPLKMMPQLIAGVDCALSKDGQRIVASVVVLQQARTASLWESATAGTEFRLIETKTASQKLTFPYIPGLLSFRESPVCLAAVRKLEKEPDMFVIDGQGVAHPRRLGLAAHLGLFFDRPTIGCAKSRLTGRFEEPPLEKGEYSLLTDTKSKMSHEPRAAEDEVIGAVLRTRANVKPIFVSVGNKCTLEDAIRITLACTTKYRLPEPTRLAHQTVSELKLKV